MLIWPPIAHMNSLPHRTLWCELEQWMLHIYRHQLLEFMGGQPLHVSNVKAMVDHMNSQASFWNETTVSSNKTILNNLSSSFNQLSSFARLVKFFLGTSLLGNTIGKSWQVIQWRAMACVTGRLYLVTAYLDERQGPIWEATHSCGLKLRKLNRISQLSESDCSYVFPCHDVSNYMTFGQHQMNALRSIWFHRDGHQMVSWWSLVQRLHSRFYVHVINVLECCNGQPSYDWNIIWGSTCLVLSAMNQVTDRWEVICSDDDGLTCSGKSSSIRRWEKSKWHHACWSCAFWETLCRFGLYPLSRDSQSICWSQL